MSPVNNGKQVSTVSVELGTYKRMATLTVLVVDEDAPAPSPTAVKIATDDESSKDLYADVAFSWEAV